MRNHIVGRFLKVFAFLALTHSALAQAAVRDEYPTGKERGTHFEYFTREQLPIRAG